MLESMQKWYRKETWGESFAYALDAGRRRAADADVALAALAGRSQTAGASCGPPRFSSAVSWRTVGSLQPEVAALGDDDPQVRTAAVTRCFEYIPHVAGRLLNRQEEQEIGDRVAPIVRQLVPLLDDPLRSVRAETGRVLARLPHAARRRPCSMATSARNWTEPSRSILLACSSRTIAVEPTWSSGVLYETLGREADALAAYRTAMRVEPRMTGPRSNLADLLDRICERELQRSIDGQPNAQVLQLQAEAKQLRREELELLARDARLLPNSGSVQYRYGLSLYLNGEQEKAEQALRAACRLEPDNDRFLYFLVLFFDRYERYDEALEAVDRLVRLRPNEPSYVQLRDLLGEKRRNPTKE